MFKGFLAAGIPLAFAAHHALAAQNPVPGKNDPRVGYFTYMSDDVYRIWSTPDASLLIKLGDGEEFDSIGGADMCSPAAKEFANCGIEAIPRTNFVHLKFHRCLIPEPMQMITKSAAGELRSYNFEVHTEPTICADAGAPSKDPNWRLVSSANAAEAPVGAGNLRYISTNALTAQAATPIFYSVAFRYPGDEAKKWRESARERREREKQDKVADLLRQEVELSARDPWHGAANRAYKARGSTAIEPRLVWDNQYSTAMTFPGMQRVPVPYRVIAPEGYACSDDEPPPEKEQSAQYDPNGDTLTLIGTAKVWRLRSGDGAVLDLCNMRYSPIGATPGTGTVSPHVVRVVKGRDK